MSLRNFVISLRAEGLTKPEIARRLNCSQERVRQILGNIRRPAAPSWGSIYFLQTGPFVKIGHAKDVATRVHQLTEASPYPAQLLGAIPGQRQHEVAMHRRWSALCHRGEWFHATTELLDWIRATITSPPYAP